MRTHKKSVVRWPLVAGFMGMIAVLLGCATEGTATAAATVNPTPTVTEAPLLRLEDGAVKAKVPGENEDWIPVAGEATFELVGELQGTEPWMVTGNTFAIRDTTEIAEGLKPGVFVRVDGILLEDNTWLANSIELAAEEQPQNPAIVLIGKVNSTEPWIVHGIVLNVTTDTVVTGEIASDRIVVVEILLLDDGTWEVLSLTPLSTFTEIPGCATVMATIDSVNDNEVEFTGWPVIALEAEMTIENENSEPANLSAGQNVLVVVCTAEEGGFVITKIITLERSAAYGLHAAEEVLICHKPGRKAGLTLSVPESALIAHLAHGDTRGTCP